MTLLLTRGRNPDISRVRFQTNLEVLKSKGLPIQCTASASTLLSLLLAPASNALMYLWTPSWYERQMHKGVAPTLHFCLRVQTVAMTYGYGSSLVKLNHLVNSAPYSKVWNVPTPKHNRIPIQGLRHLRVRLS